MVNDGPSFYEDRGVRLLSFSPMVLGIEKLDIRTDKNEELDGCVIEYATAIANWRKNEYPGVSTRKNIRLWKRQSNVTMKIYRIIAMYD